MSELNSLINLHENNERLMEIDELKGGLPRLLTDQKSKLQTISTAQKDEDFVWYNVQIIRVRD